MPAVQRLHHCVWVVRQNSQTLGLQLLLTPATSWVEQDSCCWCLLQKLGQGQGDWLGTTLTLGCPLISAPLPSQAGLSTGDAFLDLLISASELGGGGLWTASTLGQPLISSTWLSQTWLRTRDASLDLLNSASELGGGGLGVALSHVLGCFVGSNSQGGQSGRWTKHTCCEDLLMGLQKGPQRNRLTWICRTFSPA